MDQAFSSDSQGYYPLSIASKLLGIDEMLIRGLLFDGLPQEQLDEPLWIPELYKTDGEIALSFKDLLELRIAYKLHLAGMPLFVLGNYIKRQGCANKVAYPLLKSVNQCHVDLIKVLLNLCPSATFANTPDIVRARYYREYKLSYQGVVFAGLEPTKWYPIPRSTAIVLDPSKLYGRPIIESTCTPTSALYSDVMSEDAYLAIGRSFNLTPDSVEMAISFEKHGPF